ncbi:MAG: hypothetical protein H0V63_06490 [Burkholderiaceae bacterium]|nr:hypothetical protein [Burkholderiaceae bacterium]
MRWIGSSFWGNSGHVMCKAINQNRLNLTVQISIRHFLSVTPPLALCLSMMACDGRGRAYEDERLRRLSTGDSTEQDVRKVFGNPAAVRNLTDGKGLIYPLAPEKPHTLLIKIDVGGRYQGREELLSRENFARIRPGMSKVDVLGMLGQPTRSDKYPAKQQTAWEWRFLDSNAQRVFVVRFGAQGTVASSTIEDNSQSGSR